MDTHRALRFWKALRNPRAQNYGGDRKLLPGSLPGRSNSQTGNGPARSTAGSALPGSNGMLKAITDPSKGPRAASAT